MKQQVSEVMACRFRFEHRHIQHVGKPRERMPVTRVVGFECPLSVVPVQPLQHVLVFRDVTRIVVTDEIISEHRPVNGRGHGGEGNADCDYAAHQGWALGPGQ